MLDVTRPGPDYTLRWPRELFVQEALGVADGPNPGDEGRLERPGRVAVDRGGVRR